MSKKGVPPRGPRETRPANYRGKKSSGKRNLAILGFVAIIIVLGIFATTRPQSNPPSISPSSSAWQTATLTDYDTTRGDFTVSQFFTQKKVVVLELMAIWCPFCQQQGAQIKQAVASYANNPDVVFISVDVDPNESIDRLRTYVSQNGFGGSNWYYAKDTTGAFLSSFIRSEQNEIPFTPIYLFDRNGGGATLLPGSYGSPKPASEIIQAVNGKLSL